MLFSGYTVDTLLNMYWDGKLPINPIDIAKKLNILVKHNLELNGVSKFYIDEEYNPIIEVKDITDTTKLRFIIAHMLAHFSLKHGIEVLDTNNNFSIYTLDHKEKEANRFALELLIPKIAMFKLIEKNITCFSKLANTFDVSATVMRLRLQQLNII